MGRKYKTSRGVLVDIGALQAANENAVAVGNMGVNAKGDVIKGGKVVQTAKERIEPYYGNKTQTAKASLKPPIKEAPKEVKKREPISSALKTRSDGTQYKETMDEDGNIEIEEILEQEPEPAKEKKKKGKRPTV